jgi:hypothetical protein
MGKPFNQDASFLISASYTDNGGNNIQPQTGFGSYLLKSPAMDFSEINNLKGYTKVEFDDRYVGVVPNEEAFFSIDSIDLSGIKSLEFQYGAQKAPSRGYSLEVRLDKQDGQLLGTGSITSITDVKKSPSGKTAVKITPITDGKFHNIYVITKPNNTGSEQAGIVTIRFK